MKNYTRVLWIVLLLLLGANGWVDAQVGRKFWFVAPDVTVSHSGDGPYAIRITAGATDSRIKISWPADSVTYPSIYVDVPANTQKTIDTNGALGSTSKIENFPLNTVNKKGMLLEVIKLTNGSPGSDITCYFEVTNSNNPDIFTLKGENALGTDFYIPSQNSYPNNEMGTQPKEQVNIVATENDTEITITPKVKITASGSVPGTAGVPFKITLDKGESYSFEAQDWATTSVCLGGTHITSDKKIAVTVSDDSIEQYAPGAGTQESYDLIGDQIVPTNIIGSEYIAVKASSDVNNVNKVYLTATDKATKVEINGGAANGGSDINLLAGETRLVDFPTGSSAMHIKSINNPIYVYQVSGVQKVGKATNEFGSMLLPTISGCTGSKRVSFTRQWAEDYFVQLMTKQSSIDDFKMYSGNSATPDNGLSNALNGSTTTPSNEWKQVGTSEWYTKSVNMRYTPYGISNSTYSIENTTGLFHLSVMDYNGSSLSGGYFSSYNSVAIEPVTQACVGANVVLTAKDLGGSYMWTSKTTGNTILSSTNSLTVTKEDRYYLTRDEKVGCLAVDSLDVDFTTPDFTLTSPGTVCPNVPITFTLPAQYTYVWSPSGATGNSITITPKNGETINLSVVGTATDGCKKTESTQVISVKADTVSLTHVAAVVCEKDTIKNLTSMASYQWFRDGVAIPNSNFSYIIASVSGTASSVYTVVGTSTDGCTSTDSKTITVNPLPVVDIIDQIVCFNNPALFTLPAISGQTYRWESVTGPTGNSYTATKAGKVWVQAALKGCVAKDSAQVIYRTDIKVNLSYFIGGGATSVALDEIFTCAETPVNLSVPNTFNSYSWTIPGQTPVPGSSQVVPVLANTNKLVKVVVADVNGCSAKDSVTLRGYPTLNITTNKSAYCLGETMSITSALSSYQWIRKSDNVLVATGSSYVAAAAGVYTVKGIDNNGCTSTSIDVTVNPLPAVALSGPTVCDGSPFVFTGAPSTGVNYLWSQPTVPAEIKSYTSQTFSVTVDASTTLEVEDQITKCKASASAMPLWHKAPTANISYTNSFLGTVVTGDDISLCPNAVVLLNGTATSQSGAALTYQWFVDGIDQNSNTPTLNVTGPTTGNKTVRLKVTDSNGCTVEDTVRLIALPDPNNIFLGNNEICLGEQLSVESFRASLSSHWWTFNSITVSTQYTFTPSPGGTYTLNIINKDGCSAQRDYEVHDPSITVTNDDVLICTSTPSQTFAVDSPDPINYNYVWTSAKPATNFTGTPFNATTEGTYLVTATHKTLGCWDTTSVILRRPPTQITNINGTLTVCDLKGSAVPIDVIGDASLINYKWSKWNSATSTYDVIAGANASTYTIPLPLVSNLYKIEADYVGASTICPVEQTFNFNVLAAIPVLAFTNPAQICEGDEIILQANYGFVSYEWFTVVAGVETTTNIKTLTYNASTTGTYRLKAKQGNGCPGQGDITVTVTPTPVRSFTPPAQTCEGEAITVTNSAVPAYGYKWIYNNKVVDTDNSFTYTKSGAYSIIINDLAKAECTLKYDWTNNPPSKPVLTMPDKTICSNTTINLDDQLTLPITDYVSHDWYFNGFKIVTAPPHVVSATGAYELRLTVNTGGHNCTHLYTFNLLAVQIPTFNGLVTNYAICDGSKTIIDGTGVSPTENYYNYQWSFVSSAIPPVATPTFPNTRTIEVANAGAYTVTAVVRNGATQCSNTSAPIQVVVNANPTITITPDNDYLCVGGNVNLTASNGSGAPTNYLWNTGATGPVLNVMSAGTYSVVGEDNGTKCKSTMVANVAKHTPTDVVLAPFAPICSGQPFTLPALPAGTATTYQWFLGSSLNPIKGPIDSSWPLVPPPTTTTTYALNYTIDDCPLEKLYVVTVNQNPTISTIPPKSLCDGETYILDAGSNSYGYLWTRLASGSTPDVVVGNAHVYNAKTSGNYQVVARTNEGCTTTKQTLVTFNTNPIITLGNDFSSCQNATFTLTATSTSALSEYTWKTGIADYGKSSITTNKGGTYWVTAHDANKCYDTDSIDVSIYPVTRVELPQIEPLCSNETITLDSPLGAAQIKSYQWFYGSISSSNAIGKPSVPLIVDKPGQYVLQVTDIYDCLSSGSTSVAGIPAPNFKLGADRNGCVGDSLKIVAQNSYIRYMWNFDPSDNQWFKLTDPTITQYTLEVEDRNGCIATSSVNYVSNPLPIPFLGNDITQCEGTLATITPVGGPYKSILWSTGETTSSITIVEGSYEVSVVDNNGCVGKDMVTQFWWPNPRPDLGPDEQVCQNTFLPLVAESGYVTYEWQTGSNAQTILAQFADTLNRVDVTDNFNCKGFDEKLVYVIPSPEYIVSPDTALCSNYTYILDAGTLYPTVLWSTGETTQTIEVSTSGDYWIEANDGCVTVQDTINIQFYERPIITALDTMIYAQINIEAEGGLEPYLYTLNQGTLQSSNAFKYLANGVYEAYVEDARKCWDIDSVAIYSVIDIDIPNFFTPNNDGHNDNWVVDGLQERFPDASIIVYDRYNREIIKLKGDGDGWDGTYLGKDMPSDDYWFVINLVHVNKTLKGNITLKR